MHTENSRSLQVLALLAFSFSSLQAGQNREDHSIIKETVSCRSNIEGIIGIWDYRVEGVDDQYSKGALHITKKEQKYKIDVQIGENSIPAEEVEVNGNKIAFFLYVDGQQVNVQLVVDGEKISGTGNTQDSTFELEGNKRNSY